MRRSKGQATALPPTAGFQSLHGAGDYGLLQGLSLIHICGFDFPAIRLSGIHPELYSIYQAAKTISVGGDNIVIEDLAFSELVSDRAFRLILGALLLLSLIHI